MVDNSFTVLQNDFFSFKEYCNNNNIKILDYKNIGNFIVFDISCELFQYSKLKKQYWKLKKEA